MFINVTVVKDLQSLQKVSLSFKRFFTSSPFRGSPGNITERNKSIVAKLPEAKIGAPPATNDRTKSTKDPFDVDKYHVFRTLGLNQFTEAELRTSYSNIFHSRHNSSLSLGLEEIILEKQLNKIDNNRAIARKEASLIAKFLVRPKQQTTNGFKDHQVTTDSISYEDFKQRVRGAAEELDPRVTTLAGSFLLVGTSVGIVIPCMPLLVSQIGITTSEFGVVISAFGLSKLLGNIPSGFYTERYGRAPVMVAGLGLCAIGMGSVGLTLEMGSMATYWLIASRLVTGFGVSLFTGGSFMLVNDISTHLNRTRTMAPMMSGFQAGTALGPAIGGLLISSIGTSSTYYLVGGIFGAMTVLNKLYMKETMVPPKPLAVPAALAAGGTGTSNGTGTNTVERKSAFGEFIGAFSTASTTWVELLKVRPMQSLVVLNFAYWTALAGTQMTLLPLLMVSPHFSLGATEIGTTFAFMSVISVVTSQPVAILSDRLGKDATIVGGSAFVCAAMLAMPLASSFPQLLACIVPLAMGSTALNTAPLARISDLTQPSERAQALALLRTAGDLGLLLGATGSGILADLVGMESVITANGGLVGVTACWFAARAMNATIAK